MRPATRAALKRWEPGVRDSVPADLSLSLVVPTFQESANIREFLSALCRVLDGSLSSPYEVIVVDDDSPDRTWEIAAQMTAEHPQIRVVRRRGERGLASAVIHGWQAARGEILGTINADFQHPPEILVAMLQETGRADLVVASRYREGGGVGDWEVLRRVASRGARLLGRLFLPHVFGRVSDPLSGCFLFHRSVIAGVRFRPSGYKTLIEVLARGRVGRIAECPYEMQRRRRGRSKVDAMQYWQYLAQLWRLRRQT